MLFMVVIELIFLIIFTIILVIFLIFYAFLPERDRNPITHGEKHSLIIKNVGRKKKKYILCLELNKVLVVRAKKS